MCPWMALQIQKQTIGLVTQKLTYKLGGGEELFIPMGMIPGELTVTRVNGGSCGNGEVRACICRTGLGRVYLQGARSERVRRPGTAFEPVDRWAAAVRTGVELYQWADKTWAKV